MIADHIRRLYSTFAWDSQWAPADQRERRERIVRLLNEAANLAGELESMDSFRQPKAEPKARGK